jgi:putative NIF3 family GTP cyclohydrolase 1 type 2
LGSPVPLGEYLALLKGSLNANGLRYHDAGRAVRHIAVVGGSGGDYLRRAFDAGCDTFVTGDAKYDVFLLAKELGVNLIEADHFCTENTVIPALHKLLGEKFPDARFEISSRHGQTAKFFV